MKELLNRIKPGPEKGQSLVEMAITAPILIFMLIGVFEVGWALRGYLVLTNVSREITRFSVRQGYLDYSLKNNNPPTHTTPAAVTVRYNDVVTYVNTTLSDQIPLIFTTGTTSSTLIISHLVVDTGLPCTVDANGKPNCTCNDFTDSTKPNFYLTGANVLTYDDLILHPGLRGYEYFYAQKFPYSSTKTTQFNYPTEAANLARQNNKFNCDLLKKSAGTLPSSQNIIITELYYNQRQLLGFPVISNPFTDPVPMYAHTSMRVIVSSRSGENVDTVGPLCEAYPFALNSTPAFTINNQVNIVSGGWLKWNAAATSNEAYLRNELKYSRMPLNDFKEVGNPGDTYLNIGDSVAKLTLGAWLTNVLTDVRSVAKKEIRVPVGSTSGSNFVISGFAKVRIVNDITDINLSGSGQITATYLGNWALDEGGYNICLPSD